MWASEELPGQWVRVEAVCLPALLDPRGLQCPHNFQKRGAFQAPISGQWKWGGGLESGKESEFSNLNSDDRVLKLWVIRYRNGAKM